jgi:hypothetical protein
VETVEGGAGLCGLLHKGYGGLAVVEVSHIALARKAVFNEKIRLPLSAGYVKMVRTSL